MVWRYISAIVLFLRFQTSVSIPTQNDDIPVVETTLGKIRGSILYSQHGAAIYAFRGIPYAQPPIGKLRFAAPQPVAAWTETIAATQDSLICPQRGDQTLMSEDCLKLNVYSKNLKGNAAVMIYIHGGSNMMGSGHSEYEAGPQYLMDHDIVMVAFNYRLGALGFMSTGTKDAPGNFGYLDQVLALKWVQQHIACFGGNPNLVTIYGMSAGSMAVTLHMASPLSKGLFNRAIAMSGSATNLFNINNSYWTQKLANEVGCSTNSSQEIVSCLRNITWNTIINTCNTWETYQFTNMKWNYQIDGNFLAAHPTEIFLSGKFNRVPLIAGITKHELDYMVYRQVNNTDFLDDIMRNFSGYAPDFFIYNASAEAEDPPVSQKIREFYLGNITQLTKENLNQFGEIFSDGIIGHGVHRLVELVRRYIPVYYYRFDFIGERSLYTEAIGLPMAGHADDLQYIMPSLWYGTNFSLNDPDVFMVDHMTKWWTTFAADGVPQSEYEGQWNFSTADTAITLYKDRDTHLGMPPYQERFAFWDQIFQPKDNAAKTTNTKPLVIAILIATVFSAINYC